MFTSGSTGQPKGIAVPDSALVHFVRAATDLYGLKSTDRVLQFASICFDTSIEEIFPCLAVGATLVVADAGDAGLPGHFLAAQPGVGDHAAESADGVLA